MQVDAATPELDPVSAACGLKKLDLPQPEAITVNGVEIPRDVIAREIQNHPAERPIEAWLAAARALVVRELLLQEARRTGVVGEPMADDSGRRETEDEALIRALVDETVVTPEPDEATCRRIYERQPGRFRSSDLYAVRHILIAAPQSDPEARSGARERAEAVRQAAAGDPASFGKLAATHSACPSKEVGGNLGQISDGQTVEEFERALADLPIGRVADALVETRYGFHVVVVDEKAEGKTLPFETVKASIASWLVARSQHAAIRDYISMLAANTEITGIELAPLR